MATSISDDFPGDSSTKGKLAVAASVHAVFEKANDSDWFRVHLDAGVSYRFTLKADASADWRYNTEYFSVANLTGERADGAQVQSYYYDDAAASAFGFTPLTSGDYYFNASSTGNMGGYTLALGIDQPDYQDDAPNTIDTAGTLPSDTLLTGALEGLDDVDMYTLDLKPGLPYTIMLDTPKEQFISMALLIDGKVYQTASGGGAMGFGVISYDNQQAGKATIAVYGQYGDTGAYQIRVDPTTVHDGYGSDIHTMSFLIGTAISGNLEQVGTSDWSSARPEQAGASDWVRVDLIAGQRYALELYSAASSANTLGKNGGVIPKLTLMDESGKVITSAVNGGVDGDPRIEFTVPTSGGLLHSYLLSVSDQLGKGRGSYTVAVHDAPLTAAGDISNDPSKATLLKPGTYVDSDIANFSDVDYFLVKLNAGVTYDFDLTPPSMAGFKTYITTTLLARDSATALGAVNVSADGHQHLTYNAAASGYYTFGVSQSMFSGAYRLAFGLAAQQDDVGDTLTTAGVLTVGAAASKGSIAPYQDVDVYRVHLDQGLAYDFYLDGGYFTEGTKAMWEGGVLRLLDSRGVAIGTPVTDTGASVAHLAYTAKAAGDYYLAVSSSQGSGGTYNLGAERADGSAVAAPVLNQNNSGSDTGTIVLTGKAPAGGKVRIYEGDQLLGSTTASAAGTFRYETPHLADGAHKVYAVAVNAAGKLSLPGNQITVLLDATAPDAPAILSATANGGAVTVSGRAEAAALIRLWANGAELGKVLSDSGGAWSVTLTLKNGGYALTATATDALLHVSDASAVTRVQVGASTVATPTVETTDGRHLFATHELRLAGKADAGASVEVTSAGKVVASATTDAAGHWLAATSALADGHYALTARATDAGGFSSATSAAFTVDIDTTAPAVPTIQAARGADGATLGPRPLLSGTAEAGASVAIARDGAPQGQVTADKNGHWQCWSDELANGSHAFTVQATDAAGNSSASAALTVQVNAGAAQLGGAGADVIALAPGSHVVDGGAGLDTVVVNGATGAYTVSTAVEGRVLAAHDEGGTTAVLVDVERIHFSDGALAYDFESGIAGQAYRLYQAAFARQPDQAGLGFWIAQMDKGLSLHDVADGFVHSAEYASLYGAAPTSAELVTHLYQNVLHREPDAAGAAYWINALGLGVSAAEVLAGFSESAENQAQLIGAMKNGVAYLPYS